MPIKITPHLIQLTYEAALKSFWRREALKKFLRECHVSDQFIQNWMQEESKRTFLDRAFGKLQESDRGKAVICQMAEFLAEQISFPDLRNWEDSEFKIAEAKKAVTELKHYIKKQQEVIQSETEREAAKLRAREQKLEIQRSQTDKSKLQDRLNQLHAAEGTQQGGYDFESWFFDLLNFSEIPNRRPYKTNGRQIDGSLNIEGTTYLIELKFTKRQADATDIDTFKAKIDSKADNTMGVMVSISGYSSVAVSEASGKKTTLLLLDASHIYLFLSGGMRFSEIISRIRRHASQTGEAYLPVNSFSG